MPLERTVRDLLDATASDRSTPGGGAVAALVAAFAGALAEMSARYTLRPKFRDREPRVRERLAVLDGLRSSAAELVGRDVKAYEAYLEATRLPRTTDAERTARAAAVRAGRLRALEVPERCAGVCRDLIAELERLAPDVNPDLRSDVGCAVVLARGAFHAARYNVLVNARGFDAAEAREAEARVLEWSREVDAQCARIEESLEAMEREPRR